MKPPPLKLARPETLDEAVRVLADYEDAKVIAGGQSMVPMLNFRLARPSVLVDLSRVPDLQAIRVDGGEVVVRALATHADAETSRVVAHHCPLIPKALRYVGHVQIRNRGTVCGSIAHADPAAELPAVAVAAGARIVALSVRGPREIAAAEFFVGPYMTSLEPDELIVEVRFPSHEEARTAFVEVTRRSGDFPIVGIAALFETAGDVVERAALVATGIDATPFRLARAEAALAGAPVGERAHLAAAEAAAEAPAYGDLHADAEYRRDSVAVLVRRAVETAATARA
jgi:carbon-monoxide dehydrogenase medium subunit